MSDTAPDRDRVCRRTARAPYAILSCVDGRTYELWKGVCTACDAFVGLSRPMTLHEPAEPVWLVWDALAGPKDESSGVEFISHTCKTQSELFSPSPSSGTGPYRPESYEPKSRMKWRRGRRE